MKINLTAKFDILHYDGTISETSVLGGFNSNFITPEVLMKALNVGDISNLPNIIGDDYVYAFLESVFKGPFSRNIFLATEIASEPIYGQIRFIISRRRNMIMKWEYVDGNRHESK